MCVYCGTDRYRKIYESHHGEIPTDEDGRKYEIHHIDNNHSNNDPRNLVALSILEHFNLHQRQGDFDACGLIGKRMGMSTSEISALTSGVNNRNYDHKVYHLLHRDGNEFIGTQHEFRNKYMFGFCRRNISALVTKKIKTYKGWYLAGDTPVKYKKFKFIYKDGVTVFNGTKTEFSKAQSIDMGSLCRIMSGRRKSVQGWSLAST